MQTTRASLIHLFSNSQPHPFTIPFSKRQETHQATHSRASSSLTSTNSSRITKTEAALFPFLLHFFFLVNNHTTSPKFILFTKIHTCSPRSTSPKFLILIFSSPHQDLPHQNSPHQDPPH
ncbi:hypothetical protein RchiOBHm_Chr2g0119251 [Rosa chinensis]|uniref:Uncharacterized protein n=1 Tax=Rosa chinensis TaxID=74649 RepID=A0A2P6RRZ4_ROSCH|nr:hypothetical protein RchiOBHm_Chr2g0119251 [Rosa chinensis]